jgi:hypothetical protein
VKHILIICVDTVYTGISLKISWLFKMKFINEDMYSRGRVMISNVLDFM